MPPSGGSERSVPLIFPDQGSCRPLRTRPPSNHRKEDTVPNPKLSAMMILCLVPPVLLVSCGSGGERVLATGEGIRVTEEDFHREFQSLLPDDQVSVLAPGGRLDLVTRLAYREMLLQEAERVQLPDIDEWLEISETLWKSRTWLERELQGLYEAGLDTAGIDGMMSVDMTVHAVLMEDSGSAASLREEWEAEGPSEPDAGMALAPWSREGSSYFEFVGDYFHLWSGNPDFASSVMGAVGVGPTVIPAYGAWAVVDAESSRSAVPEYSLQAAARYYLGSMLALEREVTVLSPAVGILADHFRPVDGRYSFMDFEAPAGSMDLASFPGGTLTLEEVLRNQRLVREGNFFGDVPEDYAPYRLPEPMLSPEIDLWVYVENMAEAERQAILADESGIRWPDSERDLTLTDRVLNHMVTERVPEVDTTAALDFYEEHSDLYRMPELRSIKVAYVPFEWMPEGEVGSFEELGRYYSHSDEEGRLIPTDPCPIGLFGGYGEAVFSAPESVFTGPVEYPGDDVMVFFEVVDVVPAGTDDPLLILPVLMEDCRRDMVSRLLEEYLLELWDTYSIEIDSAMARQLDPWETGY